MQFLAAIALALSGSFTNAATTNATDCPYTNATRHNISEVLHNWGLVWKGDWTNWKETVMPDIQVYQDRLPTAFPNQSTLNPFDTQFVPVNNASTLRAYIEMSRQEYDYYGFIQQFHFVEPGGGKLVTRWTLNATLGNKTTSPFMKPGDVITCNGTDILIFDDCSGRIAQVITAQDLMDYTYKLGINIEHRPDMKNT